MEAYYYPMSTKKRHNKIISTLIGDVLDSLRKKEIDAFHEECSLVFYGKQKIPDSVCLTDVSKIEDINRFREMGNERLPDQCLTNILKTQAGVEFDLRYLAL